MAGSKRKRKDSSSYKTKKQKSKKSSSGKMSKKDVLALAKLKALCKPEVKYKNVVNANHTLPQYTDTGSDNSFVYARSDASTRGIPATIIQGSGTDRRIGSKIGITRIRFDISFFMLAAAYETSAAPETINPLTAFNVGGDRCNTVIDFAIVRFPNWQNKNGSSYPPMECFWDRETSSPNHGQAAGGYYTKADDTSYVMKYEVLHHERFQPFKNCLEIEHGGANDRTDFYIKPAQVNKSIDLKFDTPKKVVFTGNTSGDAQVSEGNIMVFVSASTSETASGYTARTQPGSSGTSEADVIKMHYQSNYRVEWIDE